LASRAVFVCPISTFLPKKRHIKSKQTIFHPASMGIQQEKFVNFWLNLHLFKTKNIKCMQPLRPQLLLLLVFIIFVSKVSFFAY
jgi:hypothetical protein